MIESGEIEELYQSSKIALNLLIECEKELNMKFPIVERLRGAVQNMSHHVIDEY